jgi:hypothetical protein
VTATVALATVGLLLLADPFRSDDQGDGKGDAPTTSPSPALSDVWAGVWTGKGTGNPDADGQLQPRTNSFEVTLTLHTAAPGEIAGKQVSNVREVGTGREVGCTEALQLRQVRGTTATFEAVTSHPTDRAASSLTCQKGSLYVVTMTDEDTLSLGDEGAQSAGTPSELRRGQEAS